MGRGEDCFKVLEVRGEVGAKGLVEAVSEGVESEEGGVRIAGGGGFGVVVARGIAAAQCFGFRGGKTGGEEAS